ncbi:rootletin-like [Pollicipes pollicipes]|uniref:rootletin-like n=1 Tax=Pollicipes pollicipes TaxID=41117 RepID=UPI001884C63C|nr:rootletin-like [Pollicipes pollicipes]
MEPADRLARLQRINATLESNLSSVQDMLSSSRADRDELSLKYSAVSERLDELMQAAGDGASVGYTPSLARDLGSPRGQLGRALASGQPAGAGGGGVLELENTSLRRRVEAYQQAQRQQAQVITTLHDKVEQYRLRCSRLEADASPRGRPPPPPDSADRPDPADLQTALLRLEEADSRCVTLSEVNDMLREQLDAAQEANDALTGQVEKLSDDWQRLSADLQAKEAAWREEEQVMTGCDAGKSERAC